MKKIRSLSLISVLLLSLNACKKGENDPFISLLSRDARLTGTWELKSANTTRVGTFSNTAITIYGSYLANTWTTYIDGDQTMSSYSLTITFDKDGTYTRELEDDGFYTETRGNWWWLDTDKKKTRIALDDDNESFHIDQLKNDEMILTTSRSITQDGQTSSYEGSWTYEKQ